MFRAARAVVFASLAVSLLTPVGGCRRRGAARPPTSADASMGYGLGAADAGDREDAARKLLDDGGPPADAVPHLLKAIGRETDSDAHHHLLITLGASGAPEARAVLESHLNHPDDEVREGAEKGLERWAKKTGQSVSPVAGHIARLENPDPGVRREAADDLADDGGPRPEAMAPLLAAAGKEQHPKALGAMLLTLGASGAPEAKPVIEANVSHKDADVRRYAGKAMKKWRAKNGQAVRKDVETAPPPFAASASAGAPAASSAAGPPPPDGCQQFKDICGADPFNVDKCRSDLKSLAYPQQVVWADCVNASPDACQKAHETCAIKAKAAPK